MNKDIAFLFLLHLQYSNIIYYLKNNNFLIVGPTCTNKTKFNHKIYYNLIFFYILKPILFDEFFFLIDLHIYRKKILVYYSGAVDNKNTNIFPSWHIV